MYSVSVAVSLTCLGCACLIDVFWHVSACMLHGCQLYGNEIILSVQFPMFIAELLFSLQLKAQVHCSGTEKLFTYDLSDVGSVTNK